MSALETIVIGVGTAQHGDDGFGAAVIGALREEPGLARRVDLARCDGEPSRLIDLWDGYRCALVVEAVRGSTERFGFLCRHDLRTMPPTGSAPLRPKPVPGAVGHAAALDAAVRLGCALDRLPGRLILYAVHGQNFGLGAPLSRPVALAVAHLAGRITRELLSAQSWCAHQDERPEPQRPTGSGIVMPQAALVT